MKTSSTLRFNLTLLAICLIVISYGSCNIDDWLGKAEDFVEEIVRPKTPREKFVADWARSQVPEKVVESYESSYATADTHGLRIELPHREVVYVDSSEFTHSAHAYHFGLPAGRELTIEGDIDGGWVFGELYRADADGRRTGQPVATFTNERPSLTYEPSRGYEALIFALQPEPGTRVRAEITFQTRAALLFPVAGKNERAIKSFWGDSRDGGRRSHKGNDIFAPKGTPLLAVADGRIRKVANGGLGGKTVWLYDRERGQSYYYAHLDSQYVQTGQYVERGDTLGTVGNTGNARTTPPHLHFGVYARGAYDPLPLLKADDPAPPAPKYPLSFDDVVMNVPARGNHYLRETPDRRGEVKRQLLNEEPVLALGVTGRFYRVVTADGQYGYANFD